MSQAKGLAPRQPFFIVEEAKAYLEEQSSSGVFSQDATRKSWLSTDYTRQGDCTAHGGALWMEEQPISQAAQLRVFHE